MSEVLHAQLASRPELRTIFRAREMGLQLNDLIVLAILRENTAGVDDPTAVISVREVAEIASYSGLTKSQVETSLKRLTEAGLQIREQRDRKGREVAITTLLPPAFHVLGEGEQATVLPLTLRCLLAGESGEVISAVQQAWDESEMTEAWVASLYRGGGEGWERIERLLASRKFEALAAMEAAIDARDAPEERRRLGLYELPVQGGVVTIDAHAIEREAPAPCDVEIAVEVLTIAEQMRPGTITIKNAHQRLAEALYSRHIGFAKHMDAPKAIRVIGQQMTRDTWSRPYSIRDAWYEVCGRAAKTATCMPYAQVS